MAKIGTIEGTLRLHDQFTGPLNAATSGLQRAGAKMQAVGAKMSAVGGNMTRVLTLPLAAIGLGAIKMSADFETSLTKMETLVGISRNQVAAWKDDILNLSKEAGKSPKELAEAMFFVTSAGLRGADALEALEAAAQGAALGLGETSAIADASTSAMNAYGPATMTASRATNILALAVRAGKLEASALAPVMGKMLPTASKLKIRFEDVAGAMAVMSRTGLNAAEASTSINSIMVTLLGKSKDGAEALEEVGLSYEKLRDVAAQPGGLIEVMRDINTAFDGNENALLRVVPNIRAFKGFMNVLAQDASIVDDVMGQVSSGIDVLGEGMDRIAETKGLKFNQMLSGMKVELIKLGDALGPTFESLLGIFTKITEGVSGVVKWFSSLDEGTRSIIAGGLALLAALGPTLIVLGALVASVGALTSALPVMAGAVLTVAAAFATLGIATGLALIAGLLAWNSALKDSIDEAQREIDAITTWMKGHGAAFKKVRMEQRAAMKKITVEELKTLDAAEDIEATKGKIVNLSKELADLGGKVLRLTGEDATVNQRAMELKQGQLDNQRALLVELEAAGVAAAVIEEETGDTGGNIGDATKELKAFNEKMKEIADETSRVQQVFEKIAAGDLNVEEAEALLEAARELGATDLSLPWVEAMAAANLAAAVAAQKLQNIIAVINKIEELKEEIRELELAKVGQQNLQVGEALYGGGAAAIAAEAQDDLNESLKEGVDLSKMIVAEYGKLPDVIDESRKAADAADAAAQRLVLGLMRTFGEAIAAMVFGAEEVKINWTSTLQSIGSVIGLIYGGAAGAEAGGFIGTVIGSWVDSMTGANEQITDGIRATEQLSQTIDTNVTAVTRMDEIMHAFNLELEEMETQFDDLIEIHRDYTIELQRDGKALAYVGGEFLGLFDSFDEAMDAIQLELLRTADFTGPLAEEFRAIAFSAVSAGEALSLMTQLQAAYEVGLESTTQRFLALSRQYNLLIEQLIAAGASTAVARAGFVTELTTLRDQIIGVERDGYQMRLQMAREFNQSLVDEANKLYDDLRDLLWVHFQGVLGDSGWQKGLQLTEKQIEKLFELMMTTSLSVEEIFAQMGLNIEAIALTQLQELRNIRKQARDLQALHIDLSDVKRGGSSTRKQDAEALEDMFADFHFFLAEAGSAMATLVAIPLNDVQTALRDLNDKYAEAIEKAHGNTDSIAKLNAMREEEMRLLGEQLVGDFLSDLQDFAGVVPSAADALRSEAAALEETMLALAEAGLISQEELEAFRLMLEQGLTDGLDEIAEEAAARIAATIEGIMDSFQDAFDDVDGIGDFERSLLDLQDRFQEAREELANTIGGTTGFIEALDRLEAAERVARQQLGVQFVGSLKAIGANVPTEVMLELAMAQWQVAKMEAIAAANALFLAGAFEGLSFTIEELLGWINDAEFEASDFNIEIPDVTLDGGFDDLADASDDLEDQLREEEEAREAAIALLKKYQQSALPSFIRGLNEINEDFASIRKELGNTIEVQKAYQAALIDLLRDALSDIHDLRTELMFDDETSSLSAQEQFDAASGDLEKAFRQIMSGDFTALDDFDDLVERALEENPYAQGSQAYRDFIAGLDDMLADVEAAAADMVGVDIADVFDDSLGLSSGDLSDPIVRTQERIRREHGHYLDRIARSSERLANILGGPERFADPEGGMRMMREEMRQRTEEDQETQREETLRLLRRISDASELTSDQLRWLEDRMPGRASRLGEEVA